MFLKNDFIVLFRSFILQMFGVFVVLGTFAKEVK